ncbi:MAG: oligosaccharide flippase family protein [Clostridia bacterium]|nr:oligosaccharide flippase family protein [Clostridia bacterium]
MTDNIKKRGILTLPARASVFYTLTGALERGTTLIFTPIFTRMLTPAEYGVYPLYVSWMGILTVLITLELSGNVIYKGLVRYRGEESRFISSALSLLIASVGIYLILFALLGGYFSRLFGISRAVLLFLILQVFSSGVINLYFAECRFAYKYKVPSLINIITALLSPTLSYIIVRLTAYRAEGRIVGTLAVSGAVGAVLLVGMLRRGGGIVDLKIWRYLLSVCLPLLPHFLASSVIAQSGKIALGRFFGEGAVAKYSLVFSIGFIFSLVTVGIQSSLSPWINRKLSHGAEGAVSELSERLFYIFALISLMGVTFVPEGLSVLAPPEYREALIAVYPISVSVMISFLSTILYAVIVYYERGYLVTLSSVATALLAVALHLTLTRWLGYIGAALTQCISSAFLVVMYSVMLGGVLKKRLFRFTRLLQPVLLASAFALLLTLFRESFAARASLFLALLLLLIPRALECYRLIKEK